MRCSPIIGAGLLFALLAGCQTSAILQQENDLAAAGFTVRIADTAERQAMLNIGTQQDFAQYVSNQQLDFEQAQRIALLNYDDAAWNWDAWGPWEPLGPVYGPGW